MFALHGPPFFIPLHACSEPLRILNGPIFRKPHGLTAAAAAQACFALQSLKGDSCLL